MERRQGHVAANHAALQMPRASLEARIATVGRPVQEADQTITELHIMHVIPTDGPGGSKFDQEAQSTQKLRQTLCVLLICS